MVLGSYYLTTELEGVKGEGKYFRDIDEAIFAYESKVMGLHARIKVRCKEPIEEKCKDRIKERRKGELMETTVGRLIFNQVIPSELGYYNEVVDKKKVAEIISECYQGFR